MDSRGQASVGFFLTMLTVALVGVTVVLPIVNDAITTATVPTSFTDAQLTAVANASSNTTPAFTTGACVNSLVLTTVENSTGGYTLTEGAIGTGNYTYDASTGVISWDDYNATAHGSTVNVTGTCGHSGYYTDSVTRTVVGNIPVLLGVTLLVFFAGGLALTKAF